MLKARIATAIVLLISVISGVIFLPPNLFAMASGLVFFLALCEWTSLAGFTTPLGRVGSIIMTILWMLLLLAVFQWFGSQALRIGFPRLLLCFWCLAILVIYRFPKDSSWLKLRGVGVIVGGMVVIPAWWMLMALQYEEPKYVLYLLSLIWAADIAAFFVGRRFGRRKLAPNVSPGKTWEGAFGALLAGLLASLLGYVWIDPLFSLTYWIFLALVTVSFSIVGDLFESVFKRIRHLKDSGRLLPGHGGILDRIDSLTAAIPIFTLGLL